MLRVNRASLNSVSQLSKRTYSKRTTVPSERNWDPKEIYPSGPRQVRICGNTIRDGSQSLNGGQHRIDLLVNAAPLIDAIRPADMKFPGTEEIGGGTTVDFPLRFKGENPFRNMEMISSRMPNTPTACLIRSDSICGYTINPRDVTRSFIKRYAECGIDVFRNFDAYNNVKNHETVAQAVIDAGKHYQAAITFTSHPDPTLYNVKWAGDLAKSFRDLGAHSIAIKDMAGIASPALMKAWVSEIKDVCPELPVVIHSHYTTGFAPITYMQGIEAGANGIDLAISSLSGRSGHPCMEVFTKVLSDMGYDLGFDVDDAQKKMKSVADLYRNYHPHYEASEMKMAGAVDYRVFEKGIPGGQISIFRNELIRNQMGHLFDPVIDQIDKVREQVGGVALVTPTAEHVARQSTLNAQDDLPKTTEKSRLWPGYSEMLRGVMGRPLEKQDETLQRRALLEWTQDQLKKMGLEESVTVEVSADVPILVDHMWDMVQPILKLQRIEDLKDRIRHLTDIDATKFADRIQQAKDEQAVLEKETQNVPAGLEEKYIGFLAMNPEADDLGELVASIGRGVAVNLKRGMLKQDQFLELVRAASYCTICPSSVMPDGLEMRMNEVEQLAWDHDFELPARDSIEFKEWAMLQSMFSFAQNIALNYFRFHKVKPTHWADNPYPPQNVLDVAARTPPKQPEPNMYPYATKLSCSDSSPVLKTFSDAEIHRVCGYDLEKLQETKDRLKYYQESTPETQMRGKIKDRMVGRLSTEVSELTNKINETLLQIVENTNTNGCLVLSDESLKQMKAQCGLAEKQKC